MRKTLYDHLTGSKANYLEMLQLVLEQQKEIKVQKSRLQESEAAVAAIIQTREQTVAEYRRSRSAELLEAERKAHEFETKDLIKAQKRTELQELTAPVDGTVQQLAVHTIGGIRVDGAGLAGRRAGRKQAGDRSDGVELRHRLCP